MTRARCKPDRPSSRARAAPRRGPARRPNKAGIAGIAAGANRDLVGDLPGILERHRENAGRALAQPVMTAAAIERADRDLEADAAAVTGRANGRADHLCAERS